MKLTSFKRTAVAGVAALTLVGASLGAVSAQQVPTSPNPAPTAPGGPRQGAPGQPQADRQQREQAFIAAVAAKLGIPAEQLQQAMDQTRTELGMPERGPGGPRGGPGRGEGRMGGGLDAAAQALGVTVDQLRQELAGGQTLTQVAQAHNVDPSTVANALKQAANAHIDQEAAAGRIPADQVDTAKQRAAQRIDQMMTQAGSQAGPAGRPGREGGPRGSR
jgi:hypothetical protein